MCVQLFILRQKMFPVVFKSRCSQIRKIYKCHNIFEKYFPPCVFSQCIQQHAWVGKDEIQQMERFKENSSTAYCFRHSDRDVDNSMFPGEICQGIKLVMFGYWVMGVMIIDDCDDDENGDGWWWGRLEQRWRQWWIGEGWPRCHGRQLSLFLYNFLPSSTSNHPPNDDVCDDGDHFYDDDYDIKSPASLSNCPTRLFLYFHLGFCIYHPYLSTQISSNDLLNLIMEVVLLVLLTLLYFVGYFWAHRVLYIPLQKKWEQGTNFFVIPQPVGKNNISVTYLI